MKERSAKDTKRAQNATVSLCAGDMKQTLLHHLLSSLGRDPQRVDSRDVYRAFSLTLRDLLLEQWINTQKKFYEEKKKRVYYLSLEFLVGRSLGNALINLGMLDTGANLLEDMGFDLETIREQEEDAGLGNGGLGRLAACFMDSMATLGMTGFGYGIRYEYGLFFQRLIDGFQAEYPDNWLRYGTPWEFERQQVLLPVHFYGRVHHYTDERGNFHTKWLDTEEVMAMPCDILVPGYQNGHVINMRLWTAKASREIDLNFFNKGDYISAVKSKVRSETISKVLYPSDDIREGQELRLKQQYFFVAATFQDILRRYRKDNPSFDRFADQVAVQLNDTHPAIAIPELMRLLVDHEGVGWDKAWDLCGRTFGYTNHTLMPEALETWPVEVLGKVLPRHLEIIYEINRRFLEQVAIQHPNDSDRLRRMSLIEEGSVKKVRMAHLAIVGSHSVNGVARLHSELLQREIFRDFVDFFPGRFNNKTNGITPRRWLLKCNPPLSGLISKTIGKTWITDLDQLRKLEKFADDSAFQQEWQQAKRTNKLRLAEVIKNELDISVDPDSLFDVQVKRIHEYKRQLLNILRVIVHYQNLVSGDASVTDSPPRTVIFGGKAAPSYWQAKLIIKLINSVADVVNQDCRTAHRLRVVFLPNYNVSLAEKIIPSADLSEQISTAGTEASGTGNMKLALNGALTIGTLDGANIEILEEVGKENIFIFGYTIEEVRACRQSQEVVMEDFFKEHPTIGRAMASLERGLFSKGDRELFRPLYNSLMNPRDPYMVLADLPDYLRCQQEVSTTYLDQTAWTRKSILNVARMGRFSSDRTVKEYARDVWGVPVD